MNQSFPCFELHCDFLVHWLFFRHNIFRHFDFPAKKHFEKSKCTYFIFMKIFALKKKRFASPKPGFWHNDFFPKKNRKKPNFKKGSSSFSSRGKSGFRVSCVSIQVIVGTDAGQNSRFSKRDKTAYFQNGTKQPISKRDKTADFQNETKQPIFKTGQNSRFLKRNKMSAVTVNMHEI